MFPDGKVVVLAPTKPPVLQHACIFKEHLFGDTDRGKFTGAKRHAIPADESIFAMPEVMGNDDVLEHRYTLTAVCHSHSFWEFNPHASAIGTSFIERFPVVGANICEVRRRTAGGNTWARTSICQKRGKDVIHRILAAIFVEKQ